MSQMVTNLNVLPISVQVVTADGSQTFVHLQPRSKVTLEEGCVVNTNWLSTVEKILVTQTGDE